EWGVDLILGAHSHSYMDQPEIVNDILIAQAAVGTNQIGRFDLLVDDDTNSIVDWEWQLVPITSEAIQPDEELHKFIDSYKSVVDAKYNTLLCRMSKKLTHPSREVETELGNLFSDIFADNANLDVAFIGSGSIRLNELGPVVTLKDLKQVFPYDDNFSRYTIEGSQLRSIFSHIMRNSNRNGEGECYQVNDGVNAVYDENLDRLVSLEIKGKPVEPDQTYQIGLQYYHYSNCEKNLGITAEELSIHAKPRVVATSMAAVVEEYLRGHQAINRSIEGRLVYN
ncbi:MAG: bifunctional metallophosphatase/5'-nucleotidase, partial [Chloroflexi bacterium]|nr:bifunctional metallophosphatase/5'-nucleotidase [Chloroflexota bacterium]